VGTTADAADDSGLAGRLGFQHGHVIQEFGYDDDVDHDMRDAIEALTGNDLVDEDADEVVDGVILWWREDDGDLVDAMVDVLSALAEGGAIWLLTPKSGRPAHVEPSDIEEGAPTAGLHVTRTLSASADWTATRLVTPKPARRG